MGGVVGVVCTEVRSLVYLMGREGAFSDKEEKGRKVKASM